MPHCQSPEPMPSTCPVAARRRAGRPAGRPGAKSGPDGSMFARNVGLAVLNGARPPRPMSPAEIAAGLGLPESTVRDALAAGWTIIESFGGVR